MRLPNFHLRHHLGHAANGSAPRLNTTIGQLEKSHSDSHSSGLLLAYPMLWYPKYSISSFSHGLWGREPSGAYEGAPRCAPTDLQHKYKPMDCCLERTSRADFEGVQESLGQG